MQRFLEMIATAEKYGIFSMGPGGKPYRTNSGLVFEDFFNTMGRCQPFVFSDPDRDMFMDKREEKSEPGPIVDDEIDAPFPVFSLENLTKPLAVVDPTTNGVNSLRPVCIVTLEVSPKEYVFYSLVEMVDPDNIKNNFCAVWASNSEGTIVKEYLARMSKERLGNEKVKIKIKTGSGKSKRVQEIRRIIHVSPKASTATHDSSRTIDWSHRFEVRGHWVALPGKLGKDREGNYCVADWTWRKNYIKGDESLPLIKKVRVIDEASL